MPEHETEGYPCLLRNAARRPIELHSGGVVVILAAGETVMVRQPTNELVWLERTGALTRHVAPPSPAPANPAVPGPKKNKAASSKPKPVGRKKARATSENGVPS